MNSRTVIPFLDNRRSTAPNGTFGIVVISAFFPTLLCRHENR